MASEGNDDGTPPQPGRSPARISTRCTAAMQEAADIDYRGGRSNVSFLSGAERQPKGGRGTGGASRGVGTSRYSCVPLVYSPMNSLGNAAPTQAIFRSNAPVGDRTLGEKPMRLHSAHEKNLLSTRQPPVPSMYQSFSKSQSSTETIDLADDDEGEADGKRPVESAPTFHDALDKYLKKTPENEHVRTILTTGGPQRVLVPQPKTPSEFDFDDLGVYSANKAKKTRAASSSATKSKTGSGRRRPGSIDTSSEEEECESEIESGRLLNVEDDNDKDVVLPDVLNMPLGLTETSGKYSGQASSSAGPLNFPVKIVQFGEQKALLEQMAEPWQGFLELGPMKGVRLTLVSVVEERTYFVYIRPHDIHCLVFGISDIKHFGYVDVYYRVFPAQLSVLHMAPPELRTTSLRLVVSLEATGFEVFRKDALHLGGSSASISVYERAEEPYEPFKPLPKEPRKTYTPTIARSSKPRSTASTYKNPVTYSDVRAITSSRSSLSRRTSDGGSCFILAPQIPTKGTLLFVFPEDAHDGIHITTIEEARLQPGVYLNDNIIDFDLRRVYLNLDAALQERILVLNCFFYKRLSQPKTRGSEDIANDFIKAWIADTDIFAKDLIIVPINEHLHWYLAVIVNPGAMLEDSEDDTAMDVDKPSSVVDFTDDLVLSGDDDIIFSGKKSTASKGPFTHISIMDSLFGKRTSQVQRLKDFLLEEARRRHGKTVDKARIKGHHLRVPKQDNLTDCGCFLLEYADQIMSQAGRMLMALTVAEEDVFPGLSTEWCQARRQRLKTIIEAKGREYRDAHPDMHTTVDLGNSSDVEEIHIDLS